MSLLDNGLETPDYKTPGWNFIYNRNIQLLDRELLKLRALEDVDVELLDDYSVIMYNENTSQWEIVLL